MNRAHMPAFKLLRETFLRFSPWGKTRCTDEDKNVAVFHDRFHHPNWFARRNRAVDTDLDDHCDKLQRSSVGSLMYCQFTCS